MTDRYTKTILTIIAVCLIALVGKSYMPLAKAQPTIPPITPVVVMGEVNVRCIAGCLVTPPRGSIWPAGGGQ